MGKVKKTLDKALEAIDAGKKEEAKAYVVQMANDARFSHDGMCSSLAQFLAFIANKNGEEAVYEVFRDSAEDFWKTAFMSLKDDPKKLFDLMVQAWRGHVSDFTLQEDDQKFTLVLHCAAAAES